MLDPTTLSMIIGVGVIILVGGLGLVMTKGSATRAEERLAGITSERRPPKTKTDLSKGILARPAAIDLGQKSFWNKLVPNAENFNLLYEQADVSLPFQRFVAIMGVLAVLGLLFGFVFRLPPLAIPLVGLFMGALPVLWLIRRRKKRIVQFLGSMPEGVELISRALRAGHGLASGLRLVSEEMKGPIAVEFTRVFEEQNLGIPIEIALRNMADRVPVMDVRFFVIAVVIQRQTGGDLAEVLDKIGRLIRQRFELQGHVKSLTAEGRLSGIVLLAMPPSLLLLISFLNYEYASVLFKNPTGVKLLAGTVVMQVLGALCIKKIVAIKV